MSLHICRICLADDIKTYNILNTQFQDIYERITGYKWARGNRPITICYICKSQLQRCLKLQQKSKLAEETFDQILAVGFEFTVEILPILYKRSLQTVEIAPISTVSIEPTKNTEIKEEITEIKETDTHSTRFKTFSISPIIIPCVGNEESASSSKPEKLGFSPMENNTFFNVNDVNNDYNADAINEIKNIEDDSNTEGSPEKIFKMDTTNNSSRKKGIRTDFQKNSPFDNDFYKSSLNKNAFVYIPTPVITDFSSDENDKPNLMHKTKNITPKNEIKILTNKCNMPSSTPNKNTLTKCITLTFKQNDIIIRRKSLKKNVKQKEVTQKSSKKNGKIVIPSNKDTKIRQEKENKFTCDYCTRSFHVKSCLTLHMKTHTGDRQFKCEKCPKTNICLCYLKRDKLHNLSKKQFICKTCQKSFNQRSNLDQHIRTHTGERPYSCKVCDKRFIQLSHLLKHNRVHSGEKPYSCICGKSFAQKSNLMHHRKTHMLVKPFTCDICASGFNQKSNLNNHLKSAHSLSPSALKSPALIHPTENAPTK